MAQADAPAPGGVEVTTEYVRHRNAMLARVRMSELFLDYYLHLADSGLQVEPEHDRLFKDMLTAFVLHTASRPRNEVVAWTVNLQQPLLNLFATSDNEAGAVAGRVFTDNVKSGAHNLLYVEFARGAEPVRRSVVTFEGSDLFRAAEAFYADSEQRPARLFDLGNESYALLSAHPDCDLAWLNGIGAPDISVLEQHETLVPMERRRYQWKCGCNEQRILKILAPAMRHDPDDLFMGQDALVTECPRCGALYRIGRETLEAYVAQNPGA